MTADLAPNTLKRALALPLLVFGLLHISPFTPASAAPISPWQAERAVQTWLSTEASPLGSPMGACVAGAEAYLTDQGVLAYYVVTLSPNGFVVVAADDRVEPIVAFSSEGAFDPSAAGPLAAMVAGDVSARMEAFQGPRQTINRSYQLAAMNARRKWQRLLGFGLMGITGSPSDTRVSPLVESRWSQERLGGAACYNYYTPPKQAGASTNYPCGCVATAMAQVMRYFRHPVVGVGIASFRIKVDKVGQMRALVGGDGAGGPYDYDSMVAQPNWSTTLTQRQAIGAICHDAGVAGLTSYTSDGSSASFTDAQKAFRETFGYSNVVFGYNSGANIGSGLNAMINPNLDAGFPVILALGGAAEGHAVICDGYGYSYSTLYHHLNMGWAGEGDIWYNLPSVGTTVGDYTTVEQCLYNVFTAGTGEIISGRVRSGSQPVERALVMGLRAGTAELTVESSESGVYALPKVASNRSYSIIACAPGYVFSPRTASTGVSADHQRTSGNLWGIDCTALSGWRGPEIGPSAIPDDNASGLEVSFYVGDAGLISDLDVALSVRHGRESDVAAYLVSPDGTTATLFSGIDGTGIGFLNTILDDEAASYVASGTAPFAGSFRPAQAMSAFDGKPAAGVWRLRLIDSAAGTTGTLLSWCLKTTVVADAESPTCTVIAPTSPTTISPIDFAVEFSEPVSVTSGLGAVVIGGTVINWLGSGKSYTVCVRPAGYGTVTCRIPAGVATDASGNPNTASNTASVVYQAAVPVIELTSPTSDTTFGRTCSNVRLAGTASDYDGITSVFWTNGSTGGLCTGTVSWSVDLALDPGRNAITILATDGQGDTGELMLTIDRITPDPDSAWSGLAMVSLPLEPDEIDPRTVVGFEEDYWLGYCLNMGGYVRYPDSWLRFGEGDATPGRGFWARFPDAGAAFSLCGTVPRQDQPYTIHLQPGWNIIGNPFPTPVVWNTNAIQVQATGYARMPLSQASALVASYAWGWDNLAEQYLLVCDPNVVSGTSSALEPWRGYWIKAKTACELIIPAQ